MKDLLLFLLFPTLYTFSEVMMGAILEWWREKTPQTKDAYNSFRIYSL